MEDRFARVYVLVLFCCCSFAQCLNWFTFSSVDSGKFRDYYRGGALPDDISDEAVTFQIHLLLNWGPICGVALFPVQGWLLARPGGLRRTMQVGFSLVMLGAVVRSIPTLLVLRFTGASTSAAAVGGSPTLSLALVHAGQALNACAGPFVMACVSRLSLVWFPEHSRTAATAAASTANAAGVTASFLLGPWLAPTATKYSRLLLVELAVACLPWFLALLWLPSAPSCPPSAAAQAAAAEELAGAADGQSPRPTHGFMEGTRLALANPSYGLLMLAAGVMNGAGSAWQGVLHDTLAPAGYSDDFVGYLGFANSISVNLGALVAGRLVGLRQLRRRLKLVILLSMALMLLAGLVWSLVCNEGGLPILLLALTAAMGIGNGAADPLFYELGAELTYPAPEGVSGGLLVFILNLTTLVMVCVPPGGSQIMNWLYLASISFCCCCVVAARERYNRPSDEADAREPPSASTACLEERGAVQAATPNTGAWATARRQTSDAATPLCK